MHIQEIMLTNYRGATSLTLKLDQHLNVLFGINGAGKSTVLDAMAIMLSWAVSRICKPGAPGRPVLIDDIKNGSSFSSIELMYITEKHQFSWRLAKGRQGHGSPKDPSQLAGLADFAKELQDQISAHTEKVNLPLFVYYPVNRAVVDIPLRIRERHSFGLLDAYEGALTSGANFRTFFEWYRDREDLENENRKYLDTLIPPDGLLYPDPQLEAVRRAIQQILPEFGNFAVRRNPLRMEVEKNGKRLTINQLSDGEKCLIAMVGDLARRMAIANPMRKNPLEGDGIVLIDEIDLHLHPKWQRMIVDKLLATFPACQFIISTHSPHVITHVQPEQLFLLRQSDDGITAEKPTESYGMNVDRILEDLMGLETTRPDQVASTIHNIFDMINDGKLDEARKEITTLKDEIGSDPELAKAEVLIKRMELISK